MNYQIIGSGQRKIDFHSFINVNFEEDVIYPCLYFVILKIKA